MLSPRTICDYSFMAPLSSRSLLETSQREWNFPTAFPCSLWYTLNILLGDAINRQISLIWTQLRVCRSSMSMGKWWLRSLAYSFTESTATGSSSWHYTKARLRRGSVETNALLHQYRRNCTRCSSNLYKGRQSSVPPALIFFPISDENPVSLTTLYRRQWGNKSYQILGLISWV